MATWHKEFIARCLQSDVTINDALSYGVTIEQADVRPGEQYWRVIGVHHLTGPENGFNHHLYADVLNEKGERIKQAVLMVENFNLTRGIMVVDKPLDEPGTNRPIWPSDTLSAWVSDTLKSDKVHGIKSLHPDEGELNRVAHHSFYFVAQRVIAGATQPGPDPEPDPRPEPGDVVKLPLRVVVTYKVYDAANKLLTSGSF
jgi:hypothetical protein